MKKRKINDVFTSLPNTPTSDGVGISDGSMVKTKIPAMLYNRAMSGATFKIFDDASMLRTTFLITINVGETQSIDTIILNYTGGNPAFFKAQVLNRSRPGASYYTLKYLQEGNRVRIWAAHYILSVICLTGNYTPLSVSESIPSNAVNLI